MAESYPCAEYTTRGTAADEEADPEEVEEAAEVEAAVADDDELDEQPATARTDRATAPDTPARRRTRVRRNVLFMAPSLRSRDVTKVSGS
jgi:hypothetical protein